MIHVPLLIRDLYPINGGILLSSNFCTHHLEPHPTRILSPPLLYGHPNHTLPYFCCEILLYPRIQHRQYIKYPMGVITPTWILNNNPLVVLTNWEQMVGGRTARTKIGKQCNAGEQKSGRRARGERSSRREDVGGNDHQIIRRKGRK